MMQSVKHFVLVMLAVVVVETVSWVVARVALGYSLDEVPQKGLVVVALVAVHLVVLHTSLRYSLCFSPLVNNFYICNQRNCNLW